MQLLISRRFTGEKHPFRAVHHSLDHRSIKAQPFYVQLQDAHIIFVDICIGKGLPAAISCTNELF